MASKRKLTGFGLTAFAARTTRTPSHRRYAPSQRSPSRHRAPRQPGTLPGYGARPRPRDRSPARRHLMLPTTHIARRTQTEPLDNRLAPCARRRCAYASVESASNRLDARRKQSVHVTMSNSSNNNRLPGSTPELISFLKGRLQPQLDEALRLASVASQSMKVMPRVRAGFLDQDAAEDATSGIVNRLYDAIDEVKRTVRSHSRQ